MRVQDGDCELGCLEMTQAVVKHTLPGGSSEGRPILIGLNALFHIYGNIRVAT